MALALPKTNLTLLAPLGVAACLWAWYGLRPAHAFWTGWLTGIVYFCLSFSWFGETAGRLIAPFGFLMTLGPAIGDGFFEFALAAFGVAWLARYGHAALLPFGAAALFALGEWLRSAGLGPLDVPFATLSLSTVDGPLAPLASFVGSFGVTFVLALIGAEIAVILRPRRSRHTVKVAAGAALAIIVASGLAWAHWPALSAPLPNLRVVAIQGDIPQAIKHDDAAIPLAISRYTTLTLAAAAARPAIVLWPETVIPIDMARAPGVERSFSDLARRVHTELVVGTLRVRDTGEYNSLYFLHSDGALDGVYDKQELVPFAEALPYPWLSGVPFANLIARFGRGTTLGVTSIAGPGGTTIRVAPLICWESAFSDHAVADARAGADVLLIATDDAWFGTTAGPYQHAQIAQMRAIETGRWVLRAAATGISGIVAPTGVYTTATGMNELTSVTGLVGAGVTTPYDRLGSGPIAAAFALVALIAAFGGRLRRT